MKSFWGLTIVLFGVWFLGVELSWWQSLDINFLYHFWPIILILMGISLLTRDLKYGWILVLIAFAAAIGVVALFATNEKLAQKIASNDAISNLSSFSEDLPSAVTRGEVSIKSSFSRIHLGSTNDKYIAGTLDSIFSAPTLNVKTEGSLIKANLNMETGKHWSNLNNAKNDLNVNLTNRIPLDVSIESGASDMNLDFSNITLSGLRVDTGASSLRLDIGDSVISGADLVIKAGASDLDIRVPEKIGVKLEVKSGLSSKNIENFKDLGNGSYESNNYSSADLKINLSIDAGVSSIKISRN